MNPVVVARDRAPSIRTVIDLHADDVVTLRHARSILVRSPRARLLHVGRHDERLAAHLDGLFVADVDGASACDERLANLEVGSLFAAMVLAIRRQDQQKFYKLVAVGQSSPVVGDRAVFSALGWVSPSEFRLFARELLTSRDPHLRGLGLVSCEMHGAKVDAAIEAGLQDGDAKVRSISLRAAGRLGGSGMLGLCASALNDEDDSCRFEAARAALLLGLRDGPTDELARQCRSNPATRSRALILLSQSLESAACRALLKSLSDDESCRRQVVSGAGACGDPRFVPWLLSLMSEPDRARLAGEAFSSITGLDLAEQGFEADPPHATGAPSEAAADDDNGMDEDEDLPWPDAAKLGAWWSDHGQHFNPDSRYFMGEPLSERRCLEILETGFQSQRIRAAHHLVLLRPGTRLFNCCAPAWRQRRLLGAH